MEEVKLIISIHVPKTADASFQTGLEERFGQRLLIDKEDNPLGLPVYCWPRRWRGRIKTRFHANKIAADYDAIHGGFAATKYPPLGKRAALCAFFRDPTERLCSHYLYMGVYSRSRNSRFWANNLTLERHAYLPKMRRLYERHTGNLPMERFAFVGMVEEYEESLSLFKAIFGIDIPYYRVNNEKVQGNFSARQKEAVRASQSRNYRIYERQGADLTPCAGSGFPKRCFPPRAASLPNLCSPILGNTFCHSQAIL